MREDNHLTAGSCFIHKAGSYSPHSDVIKRRNRVINDDTMFNWLPIYIRQETGEAESPLFAFAQHISASDLSLSIKSYFKTTFTLPAVIIDKQWYVR